MFDANMKHLPKGHEFFCIFETCEEGTKAYRLGIRLGDIVKCTMLDEDFRNPCVIVHLKTGDQLLSARDDKIGAWAIYEGSADGTGFIDEEVRKIAMGENNER